MKKILVFLFCILLSGCQSGSDISASLDKVLDEDMKAENFRRNNYTDYIDYYLPSDLNEMSNDETSFIFRYGDSHMVMDINISSIVNSRYYSSIPLSSEGFFDESRLIYSRSAEYLNREGNAQKYIFSVYEYDGEYLIYMTCDDLIFYGTAERKDLIPLSSRMILLAKGASVSREQIIRDFSSKEVIDYEKKQVNLFETVMPLNGNINDFLIGDHDVPDVEDE